MSEEIDHRIKGRGARCTWIWDQELWKMNGHTVKGARIGSWMVKIVIANNEKNQRSAVHLYIAPGFALMHS